MSEIYNPQADVAAEIERLERDAFAIRRRIEHAPTPADRRALNRLLNELRLDIEQLRRQLS